MKHGTHLTVIGVGVKKNECSNYSRKSCHAGKGVDLQNPIISTDQKPWILERGGHRAHHYRPRSSTGSGDVLG